MDMRSGKQPQQFQIKRPPAQTPAPRRDFITGQSRSADFISRSLREYFSKAQNTLANSNTKHKHKDQILGQNVATFCLREPRGFKLANTHSLTYTHLGGRVLNVLVSVGDRGPLPPLPNHLDMPPESRPTIDRA